MKARFVSILLLILASILGILTLFFGESLVSAILTNNVTREPESYLPLVIREPSLTPSLVCTLPACERCEELYCPGVCSDGCGIICIPVTPNLTPWCSPAPPRPCGSGMVEYCPYCACPDGCGLVCATVTPE
jgi:hypothetical protein